MKLLNINIFPEDVLMRFIIASVLLHVLLIYIFQDKFRRPVVSDNFSLPLVVTLSPHEVDTDKKSIQSDNRASRTPPIKSENRKQDRVTQGKQQGLWQKSIGILQEMVEEPEFFKQLEKKSNVLIPNYRADLFSREELPSKTTIESFDITSTGESIIVFRYPSGKTVCVKVREADPLDHFDPGSWQVMLHKCK